VSERERISQIQMAGGSGRVDSPNYRRRQELGELGAPNLQKMVQDLQLLVSEKEKLNIKYAS